MIIHSMLAMQKVEAEICRRIGKRNWQKLVCYTERLWFILEGENPQALLQKQGALSTLANSRLKEIFNTIREDSPELLSRCFDRDGIEYRLSAEFLICLQSEHIEI